MTQEETLRLILEILAVVICINGAAILVFWLMYKPKRNKIKKSDILEDGIFDDLIKEQKEAISATVKLRKELEKVAQLKANPNTKTDE